MSARVILKPGRDKSLLRHHPWLFDNAVAKLEGVNASAVGHTVDVFAHDAQTWLGRGALSPRSQMRVRIWTFEPSEAIDAAFFQHRLKRAIDARSHLPIDSNALRLVNGEADGLPGLVVDRYDAFLVCQFTTAGSDFWRDIIVEQLLALTQCRGIYERSDLEVRGKEGLIPRSGVLAGAKPPPLIDIQEGPNRFLVDVYHGHKTGFYLDQRTNRKRFADFCDQAEVLNCFAYTGAFAIAALRAGAAQVTNVESAASALALGQRNAEHNGFVYAKQREDLEDNVFQALRRFRAEERKFDVIVLDPPKFVDSRAHLQRACRGYKDINLLAFQRLRPGGLLFTFSCSGLLEATLFQKIVADAALDAKLDAQIIDHLSQDCDHPLALSFPEGAYLKGLVCRVS